MEKKENTTTTLEIETTAELKQEEIKSLQHRTNQLFELIAFDPQNSQLYMNEVIETNIRLVPHVLKKYKPFGDDEFQLGCLGLIIATRSFDPKREVPFASYACFCIERELHKAHRDYKSTFEGSWQGTLVSLDEYATLDNGDQVNMHEQIPDDVSEAEFERLLQDSNLDDFFGKIITPAIEKISSATKGQPAKVEFERWKALELQYILELADVDSQKARLSLSSIARRLNVSTQNIRMRHKRVIQIIKQQCIAQGYLKEEA